MSVRVRVALIEPLQSPTKVKDQLILIKALVSIILRCSRVKLNLLAKIQTWGN